MQYYVHDLNPLAIDALGIKIAWYWLAYILGYFWALYFGFYLITKEKLTVTKNQFFNYLMPGFIVMLVGAKLFYVLFYNLSYYLEDPVRILHIWQGGMSFHGALIACVLWSYYYSKKVDLNLYKLTDIVAIGVGPAIFFGRVTNFINGELAGRVTDVPWAVVFPKLYDHSPRHPSQLYEALLEGLLIFIILYIRRGDMKKPGMISGQFLFLYGAFRFFVEFFRTPDRQIGFVFANLSIGQVYCLIMIIWGLITIAKRRITSSPSHE